MPRRADRRLIAVALGAALLLTGCAGPTKPSGPVPTPTHLDLGSWDAQTSGNGLVLLDAGSARATMLGAVREAGTATMTGTFTNSAGRALQIDVRGSSEQTVAEFTVDGAVTSVVISDGQAYVRPSVAIGDLGVGVYTCVADDDPALTRWGALLHPLQALAEYTGDASTLGVPSDETVDLVLGADGTLGTVGIRTTGPAVPVSLTRADAAGTLRLDFSGWGEAVESPDLGSPVGC